MSKYTPRKPLHILDYRLGHYIDIYKSNIKRWMCQGKYTIVWTVKDNKYMFLTLDIQPLLTK